MFFFFFLNTEDGLAGVFAEISAFFFSLRFSLWLKIILVFLVLFFNYIFSPFLSNVNFDIFPLACTYLIANGCTALLIVEILNYKMQVNWAVQSFGSNFFCKQEKLQLISFHDLL